MPVYSMTGYASAQSQGAAAAGPEDKAPAARLGHGDGQARLAVEAGDGAAQAAAQAQARPEGEEHERDRHGRQRVSFPVEHLTPEGLAEAHDRFVGEFGLVFSDAVAIAPHYCKGALGFWEVPPRIEAEILRREATARTAQP